MLRDIQLILWASIRKKKIKYILSDLKMIPWGRK